jgi:molybdenum cofactor biosynthesis protein MoaC
MIDVSAKSRTLRTAQAEAVVKAAATTIERIRRQDIPKGNPLEVAKVAAIQAAKDTSRLIPYCHPAPVDYVGVEFSVQEDCITARVTVKAIYRTGVEMEALTGASVAALTLYDMLKMVDDSLEIVRVRLISKTGGKSDFAEQLTRPLTAAVLVMSDSVHR